MMDLIDLKAFPNSGAVSSQAVLSAVHDRLPVECPMFVTTTDNASPARLMGDTLAGGGGFGCVCHMLSLVIKQDVFEKSESGANFQPLLEKMRLLSGHVTKHKLRSAMAESQVEFRVMETRIKQPEEENATRWHSTLAMMESYVALAPAIAHMKSKKNCNLGRERNFVGH